MHHNLPPIERRHHAFHVLKDGTWIDMATGQPYDGIYKDMVDLSKVTASEWQTEPPQPLPPAWAFVNKWVMRPLCWLAGLVASAFILASLIAWSFRAYAPDWLKALLS